MGIRGSKTESDSTDSPTPVSHTTFFTNDAMYRSKPPTSKKIFNALAANSGTVYDTTKELLDTTMIGFKGFNDDMTCIGYRYEIGKTYITPKEQVLLCSTGFHFCHTPEHVLCFYAGPTCKYAKIKAEEKIIVASNKCVTSKITILELLTKDQLLKETKTDIDITVEKESKKNDDTKEDIDESLQNEESHNGLTLRKCVSVNKKDHVDEVKCKDFGFCVVWLKNKQIHKVDGPAVVYKNGDQCWYENDLLHRLNDPAIVCTNGDECWFENGMCHRINGPAVINHIGDKFWLYKNSYHRLDGPAIEKNDVGNIWCNDGKIHRIGGPAISLLKDKWYLWYENNYFHRESGPAIETDCLKVWFLHGILQKIIIDYEAYLCFKDKVIRQLCFEGIPNNIDDWSKHLHMFNKHYEWELQQNFIETFMCGNYGDISSYVQYVGFSQLYTHVDYPINEYVVEQSQFNLHLIKAY